jgi:SPP1 family predicted phage head-tail adaptor
MGIAAGRLRHRVTIQIPPSGVDATGQPIRLSSDWPSIGSNPTVWAEIKPFSADDVFNSQQPQATITHKITLRYRGDLSSTYRFSYADPGTNTTRIFNIVGTPKSPDEKREYLECDCAERSA